MVINEMQFYQDVLWLGCNLQNIFFPVHDGALGTWFFFFIFTDDIYSVFELQNEFKLREFPVSFSVFQRGFSFVFVSFKFNDRLTADRQKIETER